MLFFYAGQGHAGLLTPLDLKCGIYISNYDGIKHYSTSRNAMLMGQKNNVGGSALISENEKYEFWVFTHGVMSIEEVNIITNFQVAVKVKATDQFFHALSDTSNDPMVLPKQARLSLIKYHDGSFHEQGNLFFECLSMKNLN